MQGQLGSQTTRLQQSGNHRWFMRRFVSKYHIGTSASFVSRYATQVSAPFTSIYRIIIGKSFRTDVRSDSSIAASFRTRVESAQRTIAAMFEER
jgi:hypothetical protein